MPKHDDYSSEKWLEYLRKTDKELLDLCRVDVFKATGPGGQKKNKTSNAIRLSLSYLAITASASRSKTANLSNAVRKIRLVIALDTTQAFNNRNNFVEFPEEISPYLNSDVIRIHPQNPVFPVFAGCLLDLFVKYRGDWRKIAQKYRVSSSQIRTFVQKNGFLKLPLNKLKKQLQEEQAP